MAFDINSFNNVTSGAAKGVKIWAYTSSADTLATAIANDYLLAVYGALTEGDLIYIKASDASGWYVVLSASASAVTLGASEGAGHARVEVTSAELLALATTPKELVPAPGANKILMYEGATLQIDFETIQYAESGDNMAVKYTDASGVAVSETIECTGFITASADTMVRSIPVKDAIVANAAAENQALVLDNIGTNFTSGDSPVYVDVYYRVVNGV